MTKLFWKCGEAGYCLWHPSILIYPKYAYEAGHDDVFGPASHLWPEIIGHRCFFHSMPPLNERPEVLYHHNEKFKVRCSCSSSSRGRFIREMSSYWHTFITITSAWPQSLEPMGLAQSHLEAFACSNDIQTDFFSSVSEDLTVSSKSRISEQLGLKCLTQGHVNSQRWRRRQHVSFISCTPVQQLPGDLSWGISALLSFLETAAAAAAVVTLQNAEVGCKEEQW